MNRSDLLFILISTVNRSDSLIIAKIVVCLFIRWLLDAIWYKWLISNLQSINYLHTKIRKKRNRDCVFQTMTFIIWICRFRIFLLWNEFNFILSSISNRRNRRRFLVLWSQQSRYNEAIYIENASFKFKSGNRGINYENPFYLFRKSMDSANMKKFSKSNKICLE